MNCDNQPECHNVCEPENQGNLCSGYMDCSEGERWCNCCSQCRADCHNGRLDEDLENGCDENGKIDDIKYYEI